MLSGHGEPSGEKGSYGLDVSSALIAALLLEAEVMVAVGVSD